MFNDAAQRLIQGGQDMALEELIDFLKRIKSEVAPENQTWDAAVAQASMFYAGLKDSRK